MQPLRDLRLPKSALVVHARDLREQSDSARIDTCAVQGSRRAHPVRLQGSERTGSPVRHTKRPCATSTHYRISMQHAHGEPRVDVGGPPGAHPEEDPVPVLVQPEDARVGGASPRPPPTQLRGPRGPGTGGVGRSPCRPSSPPPSGWPSCQHHADDPGAPAEAPRSGWRLAHRSACRSVRLRAPPRTGVAGARGRQPHGGRLS